MLKKLKTIIANIIYFFYKRNLKNLKILNTEETINKILTENVSISRFGDGEFNWLLNENTVENNFQDNDPILSKRLKEVLTNKNEKLLICLPYALKDQSIYTKNTRTFWRKTVIKKWRKIKKYINKDVVYGDSLLTRCYRNMDDKNNSKTTFENLKKIWNGKNIIIIEGRYSRLGVANDLFNNAKSVKRILCPEKNAFAKYDEILDVALKQDENSLFLLALGPTATVLAYDLVQSRRRALDIGHIDIEYEWFKMKTDKIIPIKGKYVNEAFDKNVDYNEEISDPNYKKSIIYVVK